MASGPHGSGTYDQAPAWLALVRTIRTRAGGAIQAANAVQMTAQTPLGPQGPYGLALSKAVRELRLAAQATREAYENVPKAKEWPTFEADKAALGRWRSVLGQSPNLTAWEGVKRGLQGVEGIKALKRNRQNQMNAALRIILHAAAQGRRAMDPTAKPERASTAQIVKRAQRSATYDPAGPLVTSPGGFFPSLPPWLRSAVLIGGALLVLNLVKK